MLSDFHKSNYLRKSLYFFLISEKCLSSRNEVTFPLQNPLTVLTHFNIYKNLPSELHLISLRLRPHSYSSLHGKGAKEFQS